MSTIKISDLASGAIAVTDYIAKAESNGIATKITIGQLQTFLNTIGVVGFQGVLLSTDAIPSKDGIYLAGDSGTYTNLTGMTPNNVVDLTSNIVLISITETQTVFEKVDIPVGVTVNIGDFDPNSNDVAGQKTVKREIDNIVLNSVDKSLEAVTPVQIRSDSYISHIGNIFGAKPTHEVLVYSVSEGDLINLKGLFTSTDEANGTGLYCFFTANDTSSFILDTLNLKAQNEIVNVASVIKAPATANFLMVTRKKLDDLNTYSQIDIEPIGVNASTALYNSIVNKSVISDIESGVLLLNKFTLEVPNVMINFLGNAFWSDVDLDVFKYKIDPLKKYRLNGQVTATSDANGCGAYGWYSTDNVNSLIYFDLLSQNEVKVYNEYLSPPSNATYLMVTQRRGVDNLQVLEVVDGDNLGTYSNSLQFAKKKLFTIGDSFVFLGNHIPKLLETTQMTLEGTSGQEGNGREFTYFAQMIYNNDPQFEARDWHAQIIASDMVLIMGGANDYLNTNVPLGSITDVSLTDLELDNGGSGDGQLCTTIYQAINTLIRVIQDIDYTTKIVFMTQSEVGNYGGKPTATTTPEANGQGLTMANIADAVIKACKYHGIASFDTHNQMWSHRELPLYTYDNLHPSNDTNSPSTDTSTESGGDRMGRCIGKLINTL